MFFVDALFALALAVGLGLLVSLAFGIRGPWAAPWAFFVVLFLMIWAGGVWVTPVGPALYEVYWVPFLLIGLFAILLVAAAAAEPGPRARDRSMSERSIGEVPARERTLGATGLTGFFWLLVAALAFAIVAHYAL